jgi:hypothetical protein
VTAPTVAGSEVLNGKEEVEAETDAAAAPLRRGQAQ